MRAGRTPSEVRSFLEVLPPQVRRVVQALRETVREAAPGTVETIAWDALSYHDPRAGGRVRGGVCQIVVRRGVVRLDFVHGVRMPDPGGLLRGDGVSKRYVAIDSVSSARRPEILLAVRDAVQVVSAFARSARRTLAQRRTAR